MPRRARHRPALAAPRASGGDGWPAWPIGVTAIRDMQVRGAPLIGVTAAYGLALRPRRGCVATRRSRRPPRRWRARGRRRSTCPGRCAACASRWARCRRPSAPRLPGQRPAALADEDVAVNAAIGHHGLPLLQAAAERRGGRVNVLTHCNAGWLATVDWGTALAPIYQAHDAGIAGARLGRRDAAAQPGRQPDRLGAGPARRAAHA